jgi:hypothetical protein
MTIKKILDIYPNEKLIKADGFDDCIIGVSHRYGEPLLLAYDKEKVIKKLMKRDNMTIEDALEFYTYNIIGSWVGKQTPLFIERIK